MVTLEQSYTTSLNNVPTQDTVQHQAQSVLYALWTKLQAAGGTVLGTSDSTAASMDGTDRLTGTTKFVWGTGVGVARSWGVIKLPSGILIDATSKPAAVLISCSTGTAANFHLINVTCAAGTFSGTSTTADPTTAAINRAFSNKQIINSVLTNSKWHNAYSTVGDTYFAISQDGAGRHHTVIGWWHGANPETGDYYPLIIFFAGYTASGAGGCTLSNLINTAHMVVFSPDGVAAIASSAGVLDYASSWFANVTSSGSVISGYYPDAPLLLFSVTGTALRGYLPDWARAPSGTGVNFYSTVEPSSGTTTTMMVGEVWMPNGGTTPA